MHFFGLSLSPFIPSFLAIILVSALAGFWPGVLTTVFAMPLLHREAFVNQGRLTVAGSTEAMQMALFFATGVCLCLLVECYRQHRQRNDLRYRALFENMAEGIAYCKILRDRDGRAVDFVYLDVNRAFVTLTGLENVTGKRVSQVIPGIQEANRALLETYGRVAQTGQSESFDIDLDLLGKSFSIRAYSPKTEHFVAVFEDSTERKRVEKRIAHIASFSEHSPNPVFETDLDGNITYINPALARRFPAFQKTACDHPLLKDWPAIIASLKANAEHPIRREIDVEDLTLLQTVNYVPEHGAVRSYCVDITQRKHAEAETAKLQAQLQQSQKLEAVGQLAGGIAHDFNNLLMVIMAQTDLLSLEVTGAAAERANQVMKSARRAAELTGQLLAFSRKQPIQPVETSVNQLLTGMSDMLQSVVGKDIDFQVALCDAPWKVKIDPAQLEQVILNLVVNARDAMPQGGCLLIETVNITICEKYIATHTMVPAGDYAMLAVTDNGTGMSAETQSRLFEPFFTTKEPGKGTGLGLSMVYGIVKQNGGFIWVYSEPQKGTCIKIYLPKSLSNDAPLPEESAPPVQLIKRKSTILVAEDEDSLRKVILDFLLLEGHTVIEVGTAEDAYRTAMDRRSEIELLLTDVVLKGGNGKQLVHRLEQQGCNFPVIYMSGYTPNVIAQHGAMDPGTLFLQKPFSRLKLLEMVEEALASKRG